jgi:hypothetical protein
MRVYDYGEWKGGSGPVLSLAVSPDARQIATGALTGAGIIRSIESVHIFDVADKRFIIVGNSSLLTKAIPIVDARTFQVVDTIPVHGVVYDVTVDPSGRWFAAGIDTKIVVWALQTTVKPT